MISHVEEPSLQGQPSALKQGSQGAQSTVPPTPLTVSMSVTLVCVSGVRRLREERRAQNPLSLPFGTPATQAISEFTQRDCRRKRTAKCFCVTNVTGLLLMFFVVIVTSVVFGLLQRDRVL